MYNIVRTKMVLRIRVEKGGDKKKTGSGGRETTNTKELVHVLPVILPPHCPPGTKACQKVSKKSNTVATSNINANR
jgi:hypothetical protein